MRDEFWIQEEVEDTSKWDSKIRVVFWFDN
jgi:hypothetical protein